MASNSSNHRENTPVPSDDTPAEHAEAGNRRLYPRADDADTFTAGLPGGAHVRLLDLSRGGAQFECDRRLNPNANVSLRLVARNETTVVSGRVVRSRLIKLESGALGYLVAVSFHEPLREGFPPFSPAKAASTETDQSPASTFADLSDSDADISTFQAESTGGADSSGAAPSDSPSAPFRDTISRGKR